MSGGTEARRTDQRQYGTAVSRLKTYLASLMDEANKKQS
jgi:hypothetical protein